MSKKNSNVNLKKRFEGIERFSNIYQDFKRKLKRFKTNSFLVAISGGPDSLALAALIKSYSYEKKIKLQFVLVNHNIRKKSLKEAREVQYLLKKNNNEEVIYITRINEWNFRRWHRYFTY